MEILQELGDGTNMRRVLVMFILLAMPASVLSAMACETCHRDAASVLDGGPHGSDKMLHDGGCQSCHIGADAHAAAPPGVAGMLTFGPDSGAAAEQACIACHEEVAHPTGVHRRAGVMCTDCHRIHEDAFAQESADRARSGFPGVDAASLQCQSCHQSVFAEFAFNEHHRLSEGGVGCTGCHDPHEVDSRRLLTGSSESCVDCHRGLDGPFVFEHAASRVDGCLACHVPHGSANRHLLTHQSVGELCYSCHVTMPQFHVGFAPGGPPRFGLDSVCTNCHVTIHGSNVDKDFLR
jgi:DmsE family decaheme c-type cytochrome